MEKNGWVPVSSVVGMLFSGYFTMHVLVISSGMHISSHNVFTDIPIIQEVKSANETINAKKNIYQNRNIFI